jgi:hypothetical protein
MSEQTTPSYKSVKQFSTTHQAFSEADLRWQILNADTNGLKTSGAIVRLGRRLLINETKFFAWIESQGAKS